MSVLKGSSMFLAIIFNLFVISIIINCETIHFTNSPNHLIRSKNFTTYKLEVPGSNSITIIEADDNRPVIRDSDVNNNEGINKNNSNNNWKLKEVYLPSMKNILEIDESDTHALDSNLNFSSGSKKTVYAPSLLEKFLQEYSSRVYDKSKLKKNSSTKAANKLIVTRGDRFGAHETFESSFPSSDSSITGTKINRGSNPFNDKEGWVSLQAVPWSRSQIAKWKPNKSTKPAATVSSLNVYRKGYGPPSLENNESSKWNDGIEEVQISNYPSVHPTFANLYNEDNDSELHQNNYYSDTIQSVPWSNNKFNKRPNYQNDMETSSSNANDRWYDYGFRPNFDDSKKPWEEEILISDSNSNVVRVPAVSKKKPTQLTEEHTNYDFPAINRPPTYPSNGNGEWILVSTTRGYHRNRGHRGIKFSENKTTTPSNITDIRTRKSVQLTILPVKQNETNKFGMTTTQDGYLEIDSSSSPQTNEDIAAIKNKKKTRIPKSVLNSQIVHAVPIHDEISDSSAVLAAVGAGMVPATVAMLMPMVLGRKRRDTSSIPVTNKIHIFDKNFKNMQLKL